MRWPLEIRRAGENKLSGGLATEFLEHRVRAEERWEDYGLYVLLNPYRAGLIKKGEAWPWWWAPEPKVFLFAQALDERGVPPAEWMDWPEKQFSGLEVGE